ncbi:MAG TPA: YihY/virulence factor BrkB family protein [Gemmatimonadales bacterium]|nr:YihY/virulence factor BrkB family protein [Gemmatimonadales bacterium]
MTGPPAGESVGGIAAAAPDDIPDHPKPRRARRHARPFFERAAWSTRDFLARVWDNAGEDNVFFLAGGIAFNILLAAVPFALLLVSGMAYLLNFSAEASATEVAELVSRLLPPGQDTLRDSLVAAVNTRGPTGLVGAVSFVWFSTRLFGSLRSVLGEVFDIERGRGIVAGKLFDAQVTVVATILVSIYVTLNAYLVFATTRGIAVLERVGLRNDLMGGLEYTIGRLLAFGMAFSIFFALYKVLPYRRIRWQTACVAALSTSILFELARNLFTMFVRSFSPGSLYTGTIYALVIVVFWVYYAALTFIIGGEVAQVYELRRVRRLQREVFD